MCFPTLRRKVFLCVIWCHSLWLSVSRATQHIMLWCVLLLLCALWYCIELLLSAIIVQFVMPRARARLAAKWYWPIAPNSTQLTRTHHLSWGYWLENILFIHILYPSSYLNQTSFTSTNVKLRMCLRFDPNLNATWTELNYEVLNFTWRLTDVYLTLSWHSPNVHLTTWP